MKTISFNNNDQIQAVGLGTWKATGDDVKKAVKEAINAGVRHIDTAAIYDNEMEIGAALAEVFSDGTIKREDVFITSKLWNNAHRPEDVLPALKASLRKLQLNYLDLYLIHWPVAFKPEVVFPSSSEDYLSLEEVPIVETWKQMELAKENDLARHIGVSNFSKTKLQQLVASATVKPEMNQVEMHPLLQQNELVSYCNAEGILLTAYSPLGSGDRSPEMKAANEPNLFQLPEMNAIAESRGITPAQALIAWHVNRGTVVIPKSTTKKHIISNFESGNITLNDEEMNTIAGLDKNYRFINGKFFEAPEKGYVNIYDE